MKNNLILRTIRGENEGKIPIWVMRQAGRYLPEFREMRLHHTFFEMINNPELASKATLLPIERFGMDAAIIFSDILIIPQMLGMKVSMTPGVGPEFEKIISSPDELKGLNFDVNVTESTFNLSKAIEMTKMKLDGICPVIGFAGAPWTLMSYMTDDRTSPQGNTFRKAKRWLFEYQEESKHLLDRISDIVVEVLINQAKAGAEMLMVFESHAGLLSEEHSHIYSSFYLSKIARDVRSKLNTDIPLIVFAKGNHFVVSDMMLSDFDVIALDWTMDPSAFSVLNPSKVFMGNLDPSVLYCNQKIIENEVEKMKKKFKGVKWIANLGHGIYPDVDPQALKSFVNAVRSSDDNCNP